MAHPARFVFINKKVLWPWVEVIVTAGSAQCHFANATLVSRFHFVALGCSLPTLYALNTFSFSALYTNWNMLILRDSMVWWNLVRPTLLFSLRKTIDQLLCEVKLEIYWFALQSNMFWFKNKSITNRYIKKKPKYVFIPLFWLPPRAIKRMKLVSTIHTAHVSGVNVWNSRLFNIHILPIMNAEIQLGGLIRRNISWKKSNISLVVSLSKASWPHWAL